MPKPPKYGIIYNWDSSPHSYNEVPQSMEEFLERVYGPLSNTQVGALFWSLGEHVARWESNVLDLVGDRQERTYESASSYISSENIRQMLDRGEDPQKELIRRGHELGIQVYASIRMNDNHFEGAQVGDLPKDSTSITTMRNEHPEWLLGDQTSEWFALSWNFEVPEVREHRLAHIKELCELYDWDGIELDWQRHAFHLPKDHAYRLRYVLTDLQRAVKRMANSLSEKRGRPLYLAARISPTLEMSRQVGYDIPKWINENLVDILVPSGGYAMDPSLEIASYVALCKETNTAVYAGIDNGLDVYTKGVHAGHEEFVGPEDIVTKDGMRVRASATRHYAAGAEGTYVFNWHATHNSRRELLTQIGSPETLRGKDKIYAATHRNLRNEGPWRGALRNDRIFGEVPVALKRTLTSDGPTITLNVADNLAMDVPQHIDLRVRLRESVKGDVIQIFWDGAEMVNVKPEYDSRVAGGTAADAYGDDVYDVSDAIWLHSKLNPSEVTNGLHEIKVVLLKRHPKVKSDVVLTNVELVIKYGSN